MWPKSVKQVSDLEITPRHFHISYLFSTDVHPSFLVAAFLFAFSAVASEADLHRPALIKQYKAFKLIQGHENSNTNIRTGWNARWQEASILCEVLVGEGRTSGERMYSRFEI
jgi:hypothetical protein